MVQRHVLIVVSKEPIAPFDLNTPGLEHCIESAVHVEPGQYIDQPVKQGVHGTSVSGKGHSDTVFGTILSWLSSIERSTNYSPFREWERYASMVLDRKHGEWKDFGPFKSVSVSRDENNVPVFCFAGKDGELFDVNLVEHTATRRAGRRHVKPSA